jgi:Ataxin 2 SM domain
MLTSIKGLQISISTASGERFEGVFCGSTLESSETSITTKMTRRISSSNETRANGVTDQSSAFTGSGPDFAMTFEGKDVAEISLPSLNIPEASKPVNGWSKIPYPDSKFANVA